MLVQDVRQEGLQAGLEIISYSDALLEVMDGALKSNPNTMILGQGADDFKGIFGSTTGLAEKYGRDRVMDMPLMEEGMTGMALGAVPGPWWAKR